RGRLEPDLYDPRCVAARRRATGGELGHGRGLICVPRGGGRAYVIRASSTAPVVFAAQLAFNRGSSLTAVSRSIERRSAASQPQAAMPALTSAPSRNG